MIAKPPANRYYDIPPGYFRFPIFYDLPLQQNFGEEESE